MSRKSMLGMMGQSQRQPSNNNLYKNPPSKESSDLNAMSVVSKANSKQPSRVPSYVPSRSVSKNPSRMHS